MSQRYDDHERGAWIFVSHSHKDLDEVRKVRNTLEEMGHNPLLFFLRCLNDDDEVDELIRREIEARGFFLLCDSLNARTSRWVQSEITIINSLVGRVNRVLDLNDDWNSQLMAIKELSIQATIFMSYCQADRDVALALADGLRRHDYRVFADWEIAPGDHWQSKIERALDEALAHGFVLILLSPNASPSAFIDSVETDRASRVVPIVIREWDATVSRMRSAASWNEVLEQTLVDLCAGNLEDRVRTLVSLLRNVQSE